MASMKVILDIVLKEGRRVSPRNAKWTLIILAFLFLSFIIPTALRVGVDTYHEGALFPSAVGVAQGLDIFSEVNNQYGFIYSLVQAPILFIFGNQLILARLVGAFIFFLTVFFSYKIVKQKWGRQASFLVALVCLAINPSWSYLSAPTLDGFDPWINQYGVFLIISSAFLTLREFERSEKRTYVILLAGGLSLISTFVRLEFILVWGLQSILLLYSIKKNQTLRRFFSYWLIGSFIAGVTSTVYLIAIGSLPDFFNQLVLVWFSSPPNSASLGLKNLLTFGLSCFTFLAYFSVINLFSRIRYSWLWIIGFSTLVIYLLKILLPSLSDILLFGKTVGPYVQTSIDGFLLNFSSILVVCLISFCAFEFRSLVQLNDFSKVFLQVTSLGLLFQLHNINSAYISMLNPILVAWFMYWLKDHKQKYPKLILGLRNTSIALVACSLVMAFPLVFNPSFSFSAPVLKGMSDYSKQDRNMIDAKFEMLDQHVGVGQLYFDCPFGLFSVSEHGLYTADKWTWNEIPREWLRKSIDKADSGEFLLRCGGGLDGVIKYDQLLKTGEIGLVEVVDDFMLYQFE
jgi:hypothetical protein